MTDRLQRAPLLCCLPFCDPSCDGDHHALLKILSRCAFEPVNVRDDESASLARLEDAISRAQKDGWKFSDAVPEKVHMGYPLVHWAAILGKGTALKRLVEKGCLPDVVAHKLGSTTALHSAVLYLYRTYSKVGLRPHALAAFQKIAVILFRSTIHMADMHGCTPFNSACEELGKATESGHVDFYSGVVQCLLKLMMDHLSPEQQRLILNHGDAASMNTPLHLLARHDFTLATVSALLDSGADPTQRNRVGLTACELAQNHGAHSVARRLFNAVPQNSAARASPKPPLGLDRSEPSQLHSRPHLTNSMHNGRPESMPTVHLPHSSNPVAKGRFDVAMASGESSTPQGLSFVSQSAFHGQGREHPSVSASQRKQPSNLSLHQNEVHIAEGSKPVVASGTWANSMQPPVSSQQVSAVRTAASSQQVSSVRQLVGVQQAPNRRPLLPRPVQPQEDQQQQVRTPVQESPISVLGKPIPLRDVCAIPIYTLPNPLCPEAFEAAWSAFKSSLIDPSRDDQTMETMQIGGGSDEAAARDLSLGAGSVGQESSPKKVSKLDLHMLRKTKSDTGLSDETVPSSGRNNDASQLKGQVSRLPPPPPLLKMPPATPGSALLSSQALPVEETRLEDSMPEPMVISSEELMEEKLLKLICGNDSFLTCLNAIDSSINPETRDFLIRNEQQRRYDNWQAASAQYKEALAAEADLQQHLSEARQQAESAQSRMKTREKELERLRNELNERTRRLEHLRQRRVATDNRYQLAQLKSAACDHALTALPIVYERHITLTDDDSSQIAEGVHDLTSNQATSTTRTASGTSNYDSASVSSTPVVPNRSLADIALGSPGVSAHIAVS